MIDSIPLCSLPAHPPQESEFQETASDRSDDRETEDGGLSGMEKTGSSSSFFSTSTSSTLKLSGIDLKVEKPLEPSSVDKKLLCGEEYIYKTNYMCVRGCSGSHSCVPSVSLTKTFCFTVCLFMSD